MNARRFYTQFLDEIAVPMDVIEAARAVRDALGEDAVKALQGWGLPGCGYFRAGALATGTQIAPLNDVDLVAYSEQVRPAWSKDPRRVLDDVCSAMKAAGHRCETGAHAVKVTPAGEDFTADLVVASIHPDQGLWIPHCPEGEPASWIRTDPKAHRQLVVDRNRLLGPEFARQIRILKALNRKWALVDPEGRKPLSSFHLTALALELIHTPVEHAQTTPEFLEAASRRVLTPSPDPAGVGPDLEARDPQQAAQLLANAGRATRLALSAGDSGGDLLREVFGDPAKELKIAAGAQVSVGLGGVLLVGSGGRVARPARGYGDRLR